MFSKSIICCDIGTGTTCINLQGETGIVVPPEDPLTLRQAMQFLLNNPDVAAMIGNQAEKHYQSLFTADKMARAYLQIYNKLNNIFHDDL